LPKKQIVQFIHASITNPSGNFKLSQLSKIELNTIIEWASTNREGSDKRLVPTAIFFGLLGVIASTTFFQNFTNNLIELVAEVLVPQKFEGLSFGYQFGRYGLVVFLGLWLYGFLSSIVSLARNLVVQSTVIEACILARYEVECQEIELTSKNCKKGWLSWLTG